MTTESQPMPEGVAIPAIPSYAHGIVTQVNERGVQLSGREEWYNLSKFSRASLDGVAPGMTIMLTLDKAGFIRAITQKRLPLEAEAKAGINAAYGKVVRSQDEYFYLACLRLAFKLPLHCEAVPASIEEYCKLAGRIASWATRARE